MPDDLERLEKKIELLSERLRRVEDAVLSGKPAPVADTAPAARAEVDRPVDSTEGFPATTMISLIGRTLIIMGGAFLLRWLTQSGYLPQRVGSIVGVLYALLWIAMADRKAGRGERHSAAFHAVTGTMIALPLLVEVTVKFHYLTPTLSAIHLAAFILLGLVVAGRKDLRILAWIVTLPAAPVAFVLATETLATTPFLVSLLILGFVTLWLGYLRHWHVLATLMAAAANLGLSLTVLDFVMATRRTAVERHITLAQILFLLFALVALYFGSYSFRVFRRRRTITPLEIGNTLVVMLVGLGGAAIAIDAGGHSMLPLGIVCLILSVAGYVAAYGFLPRRDPNRRNFLFYTVLGLAMVLLGLELSLGAAASAVALTVIALVGGVLAKRIASPILFLHGGVYAVAAIIRSGLLGATVGAFVGGAADIVAWSYPPLIGALVLAAIYPWLPRPLGRKTDTNLGRRFADLLLFVTVIAVFGALVALIAQMSPQGSPRLLACARTCALAVSAVILAWVSGRPRFPGLAWLVYTLLLFGALKLVVEDIRAGGAAALFLSFAFYGGALIIVPRLLHRTRNTAGVHEHVEHPAT